MNKDTTLEEFYSFKNEEFYNFKNTDEVGVILITPRQMICKSTNKNYHIELINDIYQEIYGTEIYDNNKNWIEKVTKIDNNIFIKMTKTNFLVYLPDYINTTQYQHLNILNNTIKEMYFHPFKISFADMRFFDKNHDNLDELTNYFFKYIDDSIKSDEKILENNMKKVM